MAKVSIPLFLKEVTGGARRAEVPGATLAEIVAALDAVHPGLEAKIHTDGQISPNLAIVIDGRIVTDGLQEPVGPESEVNILPAFGGG